jgi:hypothetical protein
VRSSAKNFGPPFFAIIRPDPSYMYFVQKNGKVQPMIILYCIKLAVADKCFSGNAMQQIILDYTGKGTENM